MSEFQILLPCLHSRRLTTSCANAQVYGNTKTIMKFTLKREVQMKDFVLKNAKKKAREKLL